MRVSSEVLLAVIEVLVDFVSVIEAPLRLALLLRPGRIISQCS